MRDPQVSCQINGIRDRVVGGESGRHQYAQHVFFSKGFCCQCGNEGRINSPGKSEYGFREPVFVEEIFYSEDKCIVNKSNVIRSFFFVEIPLLLTTKEFPSNIREAFAPT